MQIPVKPWLAQVSVLAALAVGAGGLLGFILLVEFVEGEPRGFDTALLLALRGPDGQPLGPAWLTLAMRDLTALGGMAVLSLAGLLALGALLLRRAWRAAWLLLLALPGGMLLNTLLKQGFDRPRPDLVARLAEVQTASFPSGHAMLSAIGYLTLGALLAGAARRRRDRGYILGAAVLVTLLVGGSRVFLGVHWPSDVLAGWCLGAAWAMGCWLLLRGGPGYHPRREDQADDRDPP
ncbi:phosphatase PAP2 family protein [Siccirubricoccus sp. KC 17139]|uniref:Phosphatase PAP2 family protein n=1 Tax=Siccirubricoccus soli TaxID=2899147 RepID=A0ABT1DC50_9PROT|nr:phosphatase PAP2 family protein [Siccirubricoccus soli]MCO6419479.1 phosphatase PAP2 family protein [Siccirubricoccus soli]MCP2685614.1 phosphatase PAP2 family protein [Siccirubricoccus soli]